MTKNKEFDTKFNDLGALSGCIEEVEEKEGDSYFERENRKKIEKKISNAVDKAKKERLRIKEQNIENISEERVNDIENSLNGFSKYKNFDAYLREKNRDTSLREKETKKQAGELIDAIFENDKKKKDYALKKKFLNSSEKKIVYDGNKNNVIYDGRYPEGEAPNPKTGYNPMFNIKDYKKEKEAEFKKAFDKEFGKIKEKHRRKEKIGERNLIKKQKDLDLLNEELKNKKIREDLIKGIETHKVNLKYLKEKSGVDFDHINIKRTEKNLRESTEKLKVIESRLDLSAEEKINDPKNRAIYSDIKKTLKRKPDVVGSINKIIEKDNLSHEHRKDILEGNVKSEIEDLEISINSHKSNIEYFKEKEDHDSLDVEKNKLKKAEERLKELESWGKFEKDKSEESAEQIKQEKQRKIEVLKNEYAEIEKKRELIKELLKKVEIVEQERANEVVPENNIEKEDAIKVSGDEEQDKEELKEVDDKSSSILQATKNAIDRVNLKEDATSKNELIIEKSEKKDTVISEDLDVKKDVVEEKTFAERLKLSLEKSRDNYDNFYGDIAESVAGEDFSKANRDVSILLFGIEEFVSENKDISREIRNELVRYLSSIKNNDPIHDKLGFNDAHSNKDIKSMKKFAEQYKVKAGVWLSSIEDMFNTLSKILPDSMVNELRVRSEMFIAPSLSFDEEIKTFEGKTQEKPVILSEETELKRDIEKPKVLQGDIAEKYIIKDGEAEFIKEEKEEINNIILKLKNIIDLREFKLKNQTRVIKLNKDGSYLSHGAYYDGVYTSDVGTLSEESSSLIEAQEIFKKYKNDLEIFEDEKNINTWLDFIENNGGLAKASIVLLGMNLPEKVFIDTGIINMIKFGIKDRVSFGKITQELILEDIKKGDLGEDEITKEKEIKDVIETRMGKKEVVKENKVEGKEAFPKILYAQSPDGEYFDRISDKYKRGSSMYELNVNKDETKGEFFLYKSETSYEDALLRYDSVLLGACNIPDSGLDRKTYSKVKIPEDGRGEIEKVNGKWRITKKAEIELFN